MTEFVSTTRKGYVVVRELGGEVLSQHADREKAITAATNIVLQREVGAELEVHHITRVRKEKDVFSLPPPPAPLPAPTIPPAPPAPTAEFSATPITGVAPLTVQFSSDGTRDPDPGDPRGTHDRGPDRLGVGPRPPDDLVARHVPVRVVAVVRVARQRAQPVRGNEREPVPAVLPAATQGVPAFHHHVRSTGLLQVPAHQEARMAGSDDQRVGRTREVDVRHTPHPATPAHVAARQPSVDPPTARP